MDGPLLGNGGVGTVIGGAADNLTFYLGANEFFGGPSGGASHCGYGQGGALQLGGLTLQTPELVNASWRATQNISRSFVTTEHHSASNGLTLSTRSFLAATDNVLQIELSLRGDHTTDQAAVEIDASLWTTPEFAWDPCSGNTVAFSGCGGLNGTLTSCNASTTPTLFAARSNGFGWQQVRSRGKGGLFEHGNWNITTEVLAMHVRSGHVAGGLVPLRAARAVGSTQHDAGMSASARLPSSGNHGATASFTLTAAEPVVIHVVIFNQSGVAFSRALPRAQSRLTALAEDPSAMAQLRSGHDLWWAGYWNESFVSLPFSPLIERYYYGAQYLLAISSRSGQAVPGIFGPFNVRELGSPASSWGGDLHMNCALAYSVHAHLFEWNHSSSSNHSSVPFVAFVDSSDRCLLPRVVRVRRQRRSDVLRFRFKQPPQPRSTILRCAVSICTTRSSDGTVAVRLPRRPSARWDRSKRHGRRDRSRHGPAMAGADGDGAIRRVLALHTRSVMG